MKEKIEEKHKLPLIFNHIDFFENKSFKKIGSNALYMLKSEKYQTGFYVRERPIKSLIRLL